MDEDWIVDLIFFLLYFFLSEEYGYYIYNTYIFSLFNMLIRHINMSGYINRDSRV